jgi:hypothetical protein
MGSLAAGGAAAMGTGAFTSVSADRQVSVEVAGDNSALLRLTPVTHKISGADPAIVYQNSDGELAVDVTQGGASGVNVDAITWIGTPDYDQQSGWVDEDDDNIDWVGNHTYTPRAAFGVENRGTQDYELTFEYEYSGDPGNSQIAFPIYDGAAPTFGGGFPSMYGTLTASTPVTVPAGQQQESFKLGKRIFSSIKIDTRGGSTSDDLSGALTIRAETP